VIWGDGVVVEAKLKLIAAHPVFLIGVNVWRDNRVSASVNNVNSEWLFHIAEWVVRYFSRGHNWVLPDMLFVTSLDVEDAVPDGLGCEDVGIKRTTTLHLP